MDRADENSIREYLLGRLTESAEGQVELSLLNDPDFAEEYDIVVNEMTDEYIDGKFSEEDRKRVEEYFFKSPARRDKLKFALALNEHRKQPRALKPAKKNSASRYLATAAAIVVAVTAGLGVWRAYFAPSDLNKGLVALRSAFKDERPFEARLSDFNYAPPPNQRGDPAKVDYVQRDRAANLLLKETSEHPSAASYHALGQYYLAERQFDKAIDELNKAVAEDANNAKIHNDLGAAWLVKAVADRALREPAGQKMLERSLASLNRALELAPLPEATFNRALVYENLNRQSEAISDWQQYLRLDPASPWAAEARQRIKR